MAIISMFFQDGLTGSAWGDWALCTASPPARFRAGARCAGAVEPLGPTGLHERQQRRYLQRRRETEIKHGRVSMCATMGYSVPEYFKWPGYLSPSMI